MIPNSVDHLLLVCNNCGFEMVPPKELLEKLGKGIFDKRDAPIHCSEYAELKIIHNTSDTTKGWSIDLQSIIWSIFETVRLYFTNNTEGKDEANNFTKQLNNLIEQNKDLVAEVLVFKIKHDIKGIIKQTIEGEDNQRNIEKIVDEILENAITSAYNRLNSKSNSGPVLPGSKKNHSIEFWCEICDKEIEVNSALQSKLLNSDEMIELPLHHGQPVKIRIIAHEEIASQRLNPKIPTSNFFETSQVEELQLQSVGIDIGSSTSHLIISQLQLRREVGFLNMTNRYNIINRDVIYQSPIIDTPLLDSNTIDIVKVTEFCREEFSKAGITSEQIDTGAVIVTGEAAKKRNASDIVERIASETGKFVSATAGPNLESVLSAMGSGAVKRSEERGNTILNIDIGGGTSNLALIVSGIIVDTACVNVGGRLLGLTENNKIWRMDEPSKIIMSDLGISYQLGDRISDEDRVKIARRFAEVLIEVIEGRPISSVTQSLLMTAEIDYSDYWIDEIIFSGGVAEHIYGDDVFHQDIGKDLALELNNHQFVAEVVEPPNKIRATVIGVGSFSLSITGSTIYFDQEISLPQVNLPVLRVEARKEEFSKDAVITAINQAYSRHDMTEGDETVVLYFEDPIYANDLYLNQFVEVIGEAMSKSIQDQEMIILAFKTDVAGTIGRALRKLTQLEHNYLFIDEIELREGDWIDIGKPLESGDVLPVTIKSLVFY